MKNLRKLTYSIKVKLPENFPMKEWGIRSETADSWTIENRKTGEIKVIGK